MRKVTAHPPASPAPSPADQSRPYRLGWRLVVGIVAASAGVAFALVVALATAAGDRGPLPGIVAPVVLATVDAVAAVQLVIAGGVHLARWSARRSS